MRSYVTLSPNLSTTQTLPRDEPLACRSLDQVLTPGWMRTSQAGTDVFLGQNRSAHFQEHRWAAASLLCQGQSSRRVWMAWSLLTVSIPASAALSWLQSNNRSLIMGPTGHCFLRSFGKIMIYHSQSLGPLPASQPSPPE